MGDITLLKDKFVSSTIIYSDAIEKGDYHLANKCFKKSMMYACKMQECEDWQDVFIGLLDNENIGVKMHIAYLLLPYDTHSAIKVLEKVSHVNSIIGFNSKTTLREWRSKDLKFPVLENRKIVYRSAQELNGSGISNRRV